MKSKNILLLLCFVVKSITNFETAMLNNLNNHRDIIVAAKNELSPFTDLAKNYYSNFFLSFFNWALAFDLPLPGGEFVSKAYQNIIPDIIKGENIDKINAEFNKLFREYPYSSMFTDLNSSSNNRVIVSTTCNNTGVISFNSIKLNDIIWDKNNVYAVPETAIEGYELEFTDDFLNSNKKPIDEIPNSDIGMIFYENDNPSKNIIRFVHLKRDLPMFD